MSVRSVLLSLCGGCGLLLVVLAALAGGVAYATSTPTVPACTDGAGIPTPPGGPSGWAPGPPPVLIYQCGNAANREPEGTCKSGVGGQFCDSAFTAPPSPCKCATVDVTGCECRR